MADRITISLPEVLLQVIDDARGRRVPRSRWIAEACERRLAEDEAAVEALLVTVEEAIE